MTSLENLVKRIDELLVDGQAVLNTRYSSGGHYNTQYVKSAPMGGFRSSVLSSIQRVYGDSHPHFVQFEKQTNGHQLHDAEHGFAILQAIRSEISGNWLFTTKGLVAAELFSDFLEMAQHLLDTGYKDPAAVITGSVLEEHLRQLCLKHALPVVEQKGGVDVPLKADRINADLAKANIYSRLDHKLITAWLDLRNKAAHGHYTEYNHDQVGNFLNGVIEFMTRVSI